MQEAQMAAQGKTAEDETKAIGADKKKKDKKKKK